MLVVETIARIRREHFIKGKTIKEILQLQRAGIPTASAETLLQRMNTST